ncbi:hypothetical protein FS749_012031 [Ceratobasidium sp. UAMH 11750]|nr:hypothetical protein FS749_012031 [Ceratobasidium sp. UAMH 11750]
MRMMRKGDKNIYDYYSHLVATFGPISQLFIGKRIILVLGDRSEAERILSRTKSVEVPTYLTEMFSQLAPKASISLFSDDTWRRHRRIFRPSTHQQRRMATHVSAIAEDLAKLWDVRRSMANGGAFNAEVDIKLATMDALGMLWSSPIREWK